MSTAYGSRCRSRRPVGWPRMSTWGFSIARSRRSVICWRSWLNAECTEATTRSSAARQSSARSSEPSGQDVALDAGEQPDAHAFGVERADARGVRQRAPLVEAVGHRQRLAVVGDRDVLEPRLAAPPPPSSARRPCRRSPCCACADRREDRRGARSRGSAWRRGRVDLAAHLAQLRRNPVEAERGVDLLLGRAGDPGVVGDA